MSRRSIGPKLYVEDMLEYCTHIVEFTSETTLEAFLHDLRTRFAVIRAFEVLGEAAKRILDTPWAAHPHLSTIPLRESYATRNRFTHGYDTLDAETIWDISKTEIRT